MILKAIFCVQDSDLCLSVRAHPFKNIYELFHVETFLRKLNKKRDSHVFSQLSNKKRCGTIKSSLHGPLTSISFTSNCLKRIGCSLCIEI